MGVKVFINGPAMGMGCSCATCVILYVSEINEDKRQHTAMAAAIAHADDIGKAILYFDLPELNHFPIQEAVTVAPSSHFRTPMPVCMTHVMGIGKPPEQPQRRSSLIPGKSYTTKGGPGELHDGG